MSGAAAPDPREEFARIASGRDDAIDLATASLWIAAEEYPQLDVASALQGLDGLSERVHLALSGADTVEDRIDALARVLYEDEGFHGNTEAYYDPRNSYLNEVLERRTGIPITLAIVMMAIGQRAGIEMAGIAFPGHFLVKCLAADEDIVVDPFVGRRLAAPECEARLQKALGRSIALDPGLHLRAASPREVLVRVLTNLKQIYSRARDYPRTLACCDRILLLEPNAPNELRDRGMLYEQMEYTAAAAADYDRFLQLVPSDPAAEIVRTRRDALRRHTGKLH